MDLNLNVVTLHLLIFRNRSKWCFFNNYLLLCNILC